MRKYKQYIDMDFVERYYIIEEDGKVYSIIKDRYLTPQINGSGYITYNIRGRLVFSHKLVALKYLPPIPSDKHELNHIDGNKNNNHYTNLEWVTHSENIKKSYELGRVSPMKGVKRGSYSIEHRAKMSERKKKRVLVDGIEYGSVSDVLIVMGISRRKFNYCIKDGNIIDGHIVEVLGVL